jgi:ribonucleoside-diphosphate reductase beta chain
VRQNGHVFVVGNCHVENIIRLFHTYVEENPTVWTPELHNDLYEIAETTIKHEDAFIDLAFNMGGIEGLTAEEVKQYIRHIGDRRLLQLGLKPIFGVKDNPLPWMEQFLNDTEYVNFFEQRATGYSKAATSGTWDEAHAAVNSVA